MKIKSTIIALALFMAGLATSPALATENPTVESFTFTPTEIDLLDADIKLSFELIVSHPFGIENSSTFVTVKDSRGSTWGDYITRADLPINLALKRVTYKGALTLPRTLTTGAYTVSAKEVKNNSTAGYTYNSGEIIAKKIRDLVGAENSLLVKNAGELCYFDINPEKAKKIRIYIQDLLIVQAELKIWDFLTGRLLFTCVSCHSHGEYGAGLSVPPMIESDRRAYI